MRVNMCVPACVLRSWCLQAPLGMPLLICMRSFPTPWAPSLHGEPFTVLRGATEPGRVVTKYQSAYRPSACGFESWLDRALPVLPWVGCTAFPKAWNAASVHFCARMRVGCSHLWPYHIDLPKRVTISGLRQSAPDNQTYLPEISLGSKRPGVQEGALPVSVKGWATASISQ